MPKLYYYIAGIITAFTGMSADTITSMAQERGLSAIAGSINAWCPHPGHAIYIMAGQSNMAYMTDKEEENFLDGMGETYNSVIDCAVGSTAMSRWMVGGDLYNNMIALTDAELAEYTNSYIAGFLFWQGESDFETEDADLWANRFTEMVNAVRTRYHNPKGRTVFAQIADRDVAGRDYFRAMQETISIDHVTMILTDGIVEDGDHTDDAGYAIMRDRFINALKDLQ